MSISYSSGRHPGDQGAAGVSISGEMAATVAPDKTFGGKSLAGRRRGFDGRVATSIGVEHVAYGSSIVAICGARVNRWTAERQLPSCAWCMLAASQKERDRIVKRFRGGFGEYGVRQ